MSPEKAPTGCMGSARLVWYVRYVCMMPGVALPRVSDRASRGETLTYDEALRFMGLEESATQDDVKVAYREMAQILHPDRFGGNEKLQERATEQFKQLNEAKDVLTSGRATRSSSSRAPRSAGPAPAYDSREAQLNARITGIQAARESIVAYRDMQEDDRRNGLIMTVVGLIAVAIGHRIPIVDGLGGALAVWGIIKTINAHMTMKVLDGKLAELAKERKAAIRELKKLAHDDEGEEEDA